jgi:hypothetical protein
MCICLLHDIDVYPVDLHIKHVIVSSVKNILNWVWLLKIVMDPRSFIMSS